MKYTIEGFSQKLLIDYGLDISDALILRWFVDFQPKMAKINDNGKDYLWVKYQAVIEDLPALGINNKQVIARRFDKFVKSGIMEKFLCKDGGVFTAFKLTNKYLTLVEGLTQKLIGIDSKVYTPIDLKVDTKDSSININSSIKLKENNIKEKTSFLFDGFTDEEKESIKIWLEYKRDKKESYKSQHGYTALRNELLELRKTNNIVECINFAMAKNWKGIFAINKSQKQSTQQILHRCNNNDYSEEF